MIRRKKTDIVQFNVRLREDLRKRLEVSARAERRSLNSEIVARLEHSFVPAEERITGMRDILERIEAALAALHPAPSDLSLEAMARRVGDETEERWRANLRATAEGYRRNAKRHEARGAHEKAAEAREWADKIERDAGALTQGQAPHQSVSDQEPELPMHRRAPARKKEGST